MSSTRDSNDALSRDELLSGVDLKKLARSDVATRRIGQLDAERKPAAIVERLLKSKGLSRLVRKKVDQIVLDGENSGLTARSPLIITSAKYEELQDSTRYHIAEKLPVNMYLALREEYQRRINETVVGNDGKKVTGSQLDTIHQRITYETLSEFIGKSNNDQLKKYLDQLNDDTKAMPLCVFAAMNVGHSVTTISLLSANPDNSELAQSANEFKLIDLSGIDFQSPKVIDYFFTRNKDGQVIFNEARLGNVMSGIMARQKQVCVENGIDVVVGMPRGLASFLMNLTTARNQWASDQVINAYWDAYFKMVSESPNIKFYINPINQLTAEKEAELRAKYPSSNLIMVRDVDIRSLAITLNDREYEKERGNPDYKRKKIGYDNAGDQMGLLNETKLGRHWRVKAEGTTVGQDEFTNATTLAGITTKAADRSNILVAGSHSGYRMDASSAAAAAVAAVSSSSASYSSSSSSHADVNAVIDQYGGTLLSTAVINGDIDQVRRLLNTTGIEIDKLDNKGNTPLVWALAKGKLEIAVLLIERGASVETVDPGSGKKLIEQINAFATVNSDWRDVKRAVNTKMALNELRGGTESSLIGRTPVFSSAMTAQTAASTAVVNTPAGTPSHSATEPAKLTRQRAKAISPGVTLFSNTGWKAAQPQPQSDPTHSPPSPRKK